MTKRGLSIALIAVIVCLASRALGQPGKSDSGASRFGQTTAQRWRIGVVVTAGAGPATGIVASTPIPMDWPEQRVAIVDREVSPNVRRISERTLDRGVKLMTVTIPKLAAGETATAVITLQVSKRVILQPDDPQQLVAPSVAAGPLRRFLLPSPYIESADARIRSLASEIVAERQSPWDQASAIFDWVRAHVQYQFDVRIKSCLEALDAGVGDCEELTSLFIALCRARRIPARAVWVPGHCYPEFYLQDGAGQGRWIPCQVAGGDGRFGRMAEPRPILQKGDNFRVPGRRKPLRYVEPTLRVRSAAAEPQFRWILEKVAEQR